VKKIAIAAVTLVTIAVAVWLLEHRSPAGQIAHSDLSEDARVEAIHSDLLDNARVRVTERIMEPGAVRETHIRPTDQVIVFLNDAEYERIDPDTGEKTIRKRKAGEVIWHSRGEVAPTLTNVAKTPLRSLEIGLKSPN